MGPARSRIWIQVVRIPRQQIPDQIRHLQSLLNGLFAHPATLQTPTTAGTGVVYNTAVYKCLHVNLTQPAFYEL